MLRVEWYTTQILSHGPKKYYTTCKLPKPILKLFSLQSSIAAIRSNKQSSSNKQGKQPKLTINKITHLSCKQK